MAIIALKPVLLILGLIVVLAAVAYLYEQKWGLDGPFPTQHHHDHDHGPVPAGAGATNGVAAGHEHHDHDHEKQE